jgi:hypothetical protein
VYMSTTKYTMIEFMWEWREWLIFHYLSTCKMVLVKSRVEIVLFHVRDGMRE